MEKRIWTTGITLLAFVAAAMIAAWLPACSPFEIAWKATGGVVRATKTTAPDIIDTIFRPKHEKCLATHGKGTEGYKKCADPILKDLQKWSRFGRAGIRSGVAATYSSLTIAEKAKGKVPDIMPLLSTGVCGAIRVAKSWEAEYPEKAKALIQAFNAVGTFTCKEYKLGTGTLPILKISMDVVKWLADLIKRPVDEIKREIDDWLRNPPNDSVDKLIADIQASM